MYTSNEKVLMLKVKERFLLVKNVGLTFSAIFW